MALSDFAEMLTNGIRSHADFVSRERKGDVIEYYKETYGKQATRRAAEDLYAMGLVKNRKTGAPVGVESLMRRFQPRHGKSQGETKGEYAALGSRLPAKEMYAEQVNITIQAKQATGDGGHRDRSFTVTLTAAEAKEFAKNPDIGTLLKKKRGYNQDLIDRFDGGTYKLTVTSVS